MPDPSFSVQNISRAVYVLPADDEAPVAALPTQAVTHAQGQGSPINNRLTNSQPSWFQPLAVATGPTAEDHAAAYNEYIRLASDEIIHHPEPVYTDTVLGAAYWQAQYERLSTSPEARTPAGKLLLERVVTKLNDRIDRDEEYRCRAKLTTSPATVLQFNAMHTESGDQRFTEYFYAKSVVERAMCKAALTVPVDAYPRDQGLINGFQTAVQKNDWTLAITRSLFLAEKGSDAALRHVIHNNGVPLAPRFIQHFNQALNLRQKYRALASTYEEVALAGNDNLNERFGENATLQYLHAALLVPPDGNGQPGAAAYAAERLRIKSVNATQGARMTPELREKQMAENGFSDEDTYNYNLLVVTTTGPEGYGKYNTAVNHDDALLYLRSHHATMSAANMLTFVQRANSLTLTAVQCDPEMSKNPALTGLLRDEYRARNEKALELIRLGQTVNLLISKPAAELAALLPTIPRDYLVSLYHHTLKMAPQSDAIPAMRREMIAKYRRAEDAMMSFVNFDDTDSSAITIANDSGFPLNMSSLHTQGFNNLTSRADAFSAPLFAPEPSKQIAPSELTDDDLPSKMLSSSFIEMFDGNSYNFNSDDGHSDAGSAMHMSQEFGLDHADNEQPNFLRERTPDFEFQSPEDMDISQWF